MTGRTTSPPCPSCGCPLDEHIADPTPEWCGCGDHDAPGRTPTPHGGCATGLGCGSTNVQLLWAAMDTSDTNSWECLDCGRRWRTPYYSLADAKQDEWQAAARAAGWTPPATAPARVSSSESGDLDA